MPDYTKKNLHEVEDAAVKHGFSETQMARFAGGDLDCEKIGLALEGVKPGPARPSATAMRRTRRSTS